MQCRNSPLTKSPPPNLPNIPGITHPANNIVQRENVAGDVVNGGTDHPIKKHSENIEDAQFHMDI
jgi:translation initiation factor 4E binding protein 1